MFRGLYPWRTTRPRSESARPGFRETHHALDAPSDPHLVIAPLFRAFSRLDSAFAPPARPYSSRLRCRDHGSRRRRPRRGNGANTPCFCRMPDNPRSDLPFVALCFLLFDSRFFLPLPFAVLVRLLLLLFVVAVIVVVVLLLPSSPLSLSSYSSSPGCTNFAAGVMAYHCPSRSCPSSEPGCSLCITSSSAQPSTLESSSSDPGECSRAKRVRAPPVAARAATGAYVGTGGLPRPYKWESNRMAMLGRMPNGRRCVGHMPRYTSSRDAE